MLVLTRKCNEQVVLPALGVAFTILGVSGDKVRVGVSAPPDAKVYRHEAWAGPPADGGAPGPHAGHNTARPAPGGTRAVPPREGEGAGAHRGGRHRGAA